MTDEQLTWLFQSRLSSHNGFKCCRLLQGTALYPGAPRCEGRTTIVSGRLKFEGTCGEPCSFICGDANALQSEIDTVLQYARLVDEARNVGAALWSGGDILSRADVGLDAHSKETGSGS